MRPRSVIFACALALCAPACSGSSGMTTEQAKAADIAAAGRRLLGSWHLVSFAPEVPLEPMLQAMLTAQYNTMVIQFDGRRMRADSPGIHVDRAYQVREANGDSFKLVIFDESGVPYESTCQFQGANAGTVYSSTPPWRGVAMVQRIAN